MERRKSTKGNAENHGKPSGWRAAGSTPTGAGVGRTSSTRWRQGRDAPSSYWARLLGYIGVLLFCSYALYYYLTLGSQRTPLIALTITRYDDPLIGPNAYAEEDRQRFAQWWPTDKGEMATLPSRPSVSFVDSNSGPRIDQREFFGQLQTFLDSAQPGGPNKDTVFVYLSTHGVVDGKGEPFLYVSDSRAWAPETWISCDELIGRLAKYESPRHAGKPLRIVLFLDCTRVFVNGRAGLLYNAFADRLSDLLEAHSNRNLAICCASSPGQQAWSAPELDGTAFGYYLGEGLDRDYADANADQIISLGELSDYLTAKLTEWSRVKRTSQQQPLFLSLSDDWQSWQIADVVSKSRSTGGPVLAAPEYLTHRADQLAQLTEAIETQLPAETAREYPRRLAELQFRMQRLEQLLWSGIAYEADFQDLAAAANTMLLEITDAERDSHIATLLNVPDARRATSPERLNAFLELWRVTPVVADWKTQAQAGSLDPFPYETLAVGGLEWFSGQLNENTANWRKRTDVLDLLDLAQPPRATPDLNEVHFLRMLDDLPATAPDDYVTPAITNRLLAEEAAAPDDSRVAYWIQHLVNQADQARRLSEDNLFVGSQESLAESLQLGLEAKRVYLRAIEESKQITSAYRWRDVAYATLPHLVDWTMRLAHEEPDAVSPGELDSLSRLAQSVHDLSAKLDGAFDPEGERRPAQTDELAQEGLRIFRSLDDLTRKFQGRWEAVAAIDDQSGIGPGMVMLESPLFPLHFEDQQLVAVESWRRNKLRQQLVDLVFRPDDTTVSSGRTTPELSQVKADPFLNLLCDTERHPLIALLQRKTDQSLTATAVEEPKQRGTELRDQLHFVCSQGDVVRQLLSTSKSACQELAAKTDSLAEAKLSGREVRLGVAQADDLARAVSATVGITEFLPDTTDRLLELDVHFQTMWHVYRVLEDFWAGLPDQSEPYFAAAARSMLATTNVRFLNYGNTELTQRLQSYRTTSIQGNTVAVQAPEAARNSRENFLRVNLGLAHDAQIPQGAATVFLARADTNVALPFWLAGREGQELPRLEFPVSDQTVPQQPVEFTGESLDRGVQVEAVALYRGHRRHVVVPLPTTDREQVVSLIPQEPPAAPEIRVHATGKNRTRIVIVLDVSGSMNNGFESRTGVIQRWRAAKVATNQLLATLEALPENSYEVAIVAYGHRAGWPPEGLSQQATDKTPVLYTDTYATAIQNEGKPRIHPTEDVETIQDFVKLTPAMLRIINDRLDDFKPHGVTPLYYSIDYAINKLVKRDVRRDVANHVIVITDGVNEVTNYRFDHRWFTARRPQLDAIFQAFSTPDQICDRVAALRNGKTDLSIDIIGVLLNNREDLCGQARYWQANSMEALIRSLEKSLGFHQFSVLNRQNREVARAQAGKLVEVDLENAEREPYTVRLDVGDSPVNHTIELGGGEKMELFYDPLTRRLEHRRFEESGEIKNLKCTDPRLYLTALYPKRRADQIFEITVQNADETKFSRRPIGVWATIRPVAFDGSLDGPEAYHFYDLRFKPQMPVPVLQFAVPGWPRNIREVAIDLWLRMAPDIEPDVAREPVRKDYEFTSPKLPGIRFKMNLDFDRNGEPILIVDEMYDSNPTDLQRARIMAIPTPNQAIRRSLLLKSGGVRHEFHYQGNLSPKFIEITSRKRIQEEYVRLREPARVALPQF